MALLSANLFICENVLTEPKTGKLTAINIIDFVKPQQSSTIVRFFAMTMVYGYAGDVVDHTLSVRISKFNGETVHKAPDFPFTHAYKNDPKAPGGMHLYTEFIIDTAKLGVLETAYVVWSFLDGEAVAKTPLMLRSA